MIKALDVLCLLLVVLGAFNWAMVGLARFDVVRAIFGTATWSSQTIYTVIGLAGLYVALAFKHIAIRWSQMRPADEVG